jgi:hypothetical protein
MLKRIEEVSADLGAIDLEVSLERVESGADAERLRFVGSPTLLLGGRDPFEDGAPGGYGLSCRIYGTPDGPGGSPTKEQVREVLAAYLDSGATS